MAFSARVTTITQNKIIPKIVDGFLSDNFIAGRLLSNSETWSGTTMDFPIKYAKNTQGGSFSGLDVHNTGTVQTRVNLSYDFKGYEIPVAIPGMDETVNGSSEVQVINLVRAEMESTTADAFDDIADLFYGDGTGNGSKDFDGFANLNDDGTTAAAVGGLTRASYPTPLNGTRTSFGGTLTLAKLRTLVHAVSGGSSESQRPDYFTSTEAEFALYEQLLTPAQVQNIETMGYPMMTRTSKRPVARTQITGVSGYEGLVFAGIPWIKDEKGVTGTVWLTNERYLKYYGKMGVRLQPLTLGTSTYDGTYNDFPKVNGLGWTGFRDSYDQFGNCGHIYLLGNNCSSQPRRLGRATSVTGV